MTQLLAWVAIGMAAIFAALMATIVISRFLADHRRGREERLRPPIEVALAEYLAAEEPEPPEVPAGKAAHAVLRTIVLEMIGELHGRERDRLVALLERLGIVEETAARLGSRSPRTRRPSAEALRQIGSEQSERSLADGLRDPDLDTRLTCAAALAELSGEAQLPSLLALADRSALARPGAVAAILVTLGRRHPAAIGNALEPTSSLELRRLAAAVAGELRLAEHVFPLRKALVSEDDELAARAARGLGMIGDDGCLYRLLVLVEAEDRAWFLGVAATDALGELGDPRAVVPLERELAGDGWLLRAKTAKALGMLGTTGRDALRRALDSPIPEVRDQARVALEQ